MSTFIVAIFIYCLQLNSLSLWLLLSDVSLPWGFKDTSSYVPTLGYAVSSETGSGALTPGAVVLALMIDFSIANTEGSLLLSQCDGRSPLGSRTRPMSTTRTCSPRPLPCQGFMHFGRRLYPLNPLRGALNVV